MVNLESAEVSLSRLLLDPNNYRFQDGRSFVAVHADRYAETTVQDRAFSLLKQEPSLKDLKNSIEKNGFIPVERVVVREYAQAPGAYLVIEGNRRVAALKWIHDDADAGVEVSQELLDMLEAVPVLVAPADADVGFYESLMGIRHVSGIKAWGGYQAASLVVTMREEHDLSAQETAERLGLSVQDANRRYRARKVLAQMEEDEQYGDQATGSLYPVFEEALSGRPLREWLGWNVDALRFEDSANLEEFYQLLVPIEDDDGRVVEPRLKTFSDTRDMKKIVGNPEALSNLLGPDGSLARALAVIEDIPPANGWRRAAERAIRELDQVGLEQIYALDDGDLEILRRLRQFADRILGIRDV